MAARRAASALLGIGGIALGHQGGLLGLLGLGLGHVGFIRTLLQAQLVALLAGAQHFVFGELLLGRLLRQRDFCLAR